MKIRIFALAKELGVDSKELIEYCNRAGIELKNSALASISPEERDRVLDFMRQDKASTATAVAERPLAPPRAMGSDLMGKVREIRTMAPRPQPGRVRPPQPAADELEQAPPHEEHPKVEPTPPAVEEQPPVAPAAEIPAPAATEEAVSPAAEAPADQEEPTATPPATSSEDEAVSPAAAMPPTRPDQSEAPQRPPEPKPLRPEDYVPAAGTHPRAIREMRPQGTIRDVQQRRPKDKEKDKGKGPGGRTTHPAIVVPPPVKTPRPKKPDAAEAPAQKPDMKLTPGVLESQSPLREHLRKSAAEKEKRRKGERPPIDLGAGRKIQVPEDESGAKKAKPLRKGRRDGAGQEEGDDRPGRMPLRRRRQKSAPVALKTAAQIELPITVRSLSEALGRPANGIIRILMQDGQMVGINATLDEETAIEVALELGVDLEIKRLKTAEEELAEILERPDPEENLVERPPIVTILGHVDHGKTTLLDKIRSTNIAAGEAGGITQHIRSYQVEHDGKKITFVDTPGHAAFGEMRARGANVTDIVVLVVAADDGVMPQTVECIAHAKAAGAPMVVALNKIDLPAANEQKALQGLAAQDVLPAEWGGEVEVVRTSGATGKGIDDLLETLLLTAELHQFRANTDRPAHGVCLEAFMEPGRGVLAWLIVQNGTLRVGDIVLVGEAYGRIRAIYNDRNEEIPEAGPSTPVRIAGLDVVPGAGDHFFVLDDLEKARTIAADRHHKGRTQILANRNRPRTLDDILNAARGGQVQDLPLIIKADTPGSLEALKGEISKIQHPEVRPQIIHDAVGGVNESDVYLASASGAVIIAFHVIAEDRAQTLAEREGVEIRRYDIIYEVTDQIKRQLEGLLIPEKVQVPTGRALVLQTFDISRFGRIAGCRVLSGTIERSNRVHLIRDQRVIGDYDIASLKREKDDAREVREGFECGIRLAGFDDVKEGDLLEAFRIDEVKRTLE